MCGAVKFFSERKWERERERNDDVLYWDFLLKRWIETHLDHGFAHISEGLLVLIIFFLSLSSKGGHKRWWGKEWRLMIVQWEFWFRFWLCGCQWNLPSIVFCSCENNKETLPFFPGWNYRQMVFNRGKKTWSKVIRYLMMMLSVCAHTFLPLYSIITSQAVIFAN